MKVFKFGGASVKDADGIRNVAALLSRFANEEILVVISAMGKSTNKLEELVHAYYHNTGAAPALISDLKEYHFGVMNNLLPEQPLAFRNDIENLFLELECLVENANNLEDFDFVYDQIVCFGELLSTKIVSHYLISQQTRNLWMDARNFILTDNRYRDGKVQWDKTEHTIQNRLKPLTSKNLVITQGFIGRDSLNTTTTLGREGSDYSAAIFAYCLKAESVTIWKDVAGVMNADPKKFPEAVLLSSLSYNDCIELAYYGASVIHPKTLQPMKARNIPLYVKSFIHPEDEGTAVKQDAEALATPCFIHKTNQVLVELSTRDFTFIVEENLREIFNQLASYKVRCNIMQNSAISFSFGADNKEDRLVRLCEALENLGLRVTIQEGLELLTVYNATETRPAEWFQGKQVILQQQTGETIHYLLR
ncbi:MAG: aspartate kinase [Bacteroidetes bacterium]|nr:aspartate kinase [Bacteroidota bacterium]